MPALTGSTRLLVREARLAAREMKGRSHLARAWELLQERDDAGNPRGPLPYTDEALVELEVCAKLYPNDAEVLHHLAIARHARAWDLELAHDDHAAREWELALGHWRALVGAPQFWDELRGKLLSCDPSAQADVVDDMRAGLLEDLLDIHVDFVRHYCELELPDRASGHVQIVRRALIPPAVRKRLTQKTFEAMTASVAQTRASSAYGAALVPVERFLNLFSDAAYLPALRCHVELCGAWVDRLSYQDDWDEILRLGSQAEAIARRLAACADLAQDQMARTALETLTTAMAMRGLDRGQGHHAAAEAGQNASVECGMARKAFEFAVAWGRIGYPSSRQDAFVRRLLPAALHYHVLCLCRQAEEIDASEVDEGIKAEAGAACCRRAVEDLEEAVRYEPDEKVLAGNLEVLRSNLAHWELRRAMAGMDGAGGEI